MSLIGRRWQVAVIASSAALVAGCGGASAVGSKSKFCDTFRQLNAHPGQIFNGLGTAPSGVDANTKNDSILPAFRRIAGVYDQLGREAPAAVKSDMKMLTPIFDSLVFALSHTSRYGEARAYEQAHPPPLSLAQGTTAEQHLGGYVRSTCHVHLSS